MNTRLFLLAGAFSTLFLFSSCQKDSNKNDPGTTAGGSFSFKSDGVLWQPKSITSARLVRAEVASGVFSKSLLVSVEGKDGSTASFTITDLQDAETGECITAGTYYAIDDENLELNYHVGNIYSGGGLIITEANGNVIGAMKGSVVLQSCGDHKVSGSFEFQAEDFSDIESEDLLPLTEGKFTDIEFTIF